VAVIDRMTFDQLMEFEDSHSISLGNSVPENIISTSETKSATNAVEGSEGADVLVDIGVDQFAPVQRNVRAGRIEVARERVAAPTKKVLKVRVGKAIRRAAASHSNR
jgi:nucleoid DNA-binding protein